MSVATIEELWIGFRAATIPKDAPEEQVKEMRRAFYAGSWAVFTEWFIEEGRSGSTLHSITQHARYRDLKKYKDDMFAFKDAVVDGTR